MSADDNEDASDDDDDDDANDDDNDDDADEGLRIFQTELRLGTGHPSSSNSTELALFEEIHSRSKFLITYLNMVFYVTRSCQSNVNNKTTFKQSDQYLMQVVSLAA